MDQEWEGSSILTLFTFINYKKIKKIKKVLPHLVIGNTDFIASIYYKCN